MAFACECAPARADLSCQRGAARAGPSSAPDLPTDVLPVRSRLRDRDVLATTVRRGTRAGRRYVIIHFLPASPSAIESEGLPVSAISVDPARIAFAVNKGVGGSVVRHRVIRKLRHVIASHLDELPAGSTLVIRALPRAAEASSADLTADIEALIPRLVSKCV